jgi:nucleotide-binding universal stress UspA family protein
MFKRQLVLVAIDDATDVARTVAVALSTAKARGADLHVIQVVPYRAMHVDVSPDLWTLEPHDDRRVNIGAQLASIRRSADDDGVRVGSTTLRGTPEQVIPAYAQLHQATILVVERGYGSSRFWRNGRVVNESRVSRQYLCLCCQSDKGVNGDSPGCAL